MQVYVFFLHVMVVDRFKVIVISSHSPFTVMLFSRFYSIVYLKTKYLKATITHQAMNNQTINSLLQLFYSVIQCDSNTIFQKFKCQSTFICFHDVAKFTRLIAFTSFWLHSLFDVQLIKLCILLVIKQQIATKIILLHISQKVHAFFLTMPCIIAIISWNSTNHHSSAGLADKGWRGMM